MGTKYLLLWLEGPLQSWGFDSKFGRRDSLRFPTKSGIIGILLSSLGVSGSQRDLLARLSDCPVTIYSFARIRESQGKTIKQDPLPLLMDFHMVGSGYDDKDPWKRLLIPKTPEGKSAVGGGTKMTYRYYLQDARFSVIIELPVDLAEALAESLRSPVFDVALGRKSCVPTEFLFQGVYDATDAAREVSTRLATDKKLVFDFRVEEGDKDGEVLTLRDVPIQFGVRKVYGDRVVTIMDE